MFCGTKIERQLEARAMSAAISTAAISPPAISPAIVETLLAGLATLFLTGAGGDAAAARRAASQMLGVYRPESEDELRLAANIIGFSFHALEALGQAAAPDMPLTRVLRLRGSAVSLSREAAKAERQLAQLQKARRQLGCDPSAKHQFRNLAAANFESANSESGNAERDTAGPGNSDPGSELRTAEPGNSELRKPQSGKPQSADTPPADRAPADVRSADIPVANTHAGTRFGETGRDPARAAANIDKALALSQDTGGIAIAAKADSRIWTQADEQRQRDIRIAASLKRAEARFGAQSSPVATGATLDRPMTQGA